MNIGDRLRLLRMSKNYSQSEMADLLGIARSTYVKYESGLSKPTRQLQAIAELFGVTTDYLLGTSQASTEVYVLTENEKELLDGFKQLNEDNKIKILGMLKLLQYEQLEEASDDAIAKEIG